MLLCSFKQCILLFYFWVSGFWHRDFFSSRQSHSIAANFFDILHIDQETFVHAHESHIFQFIFQIVHFSVNGTTSSIFMAEELSIVCIYPPPIFFIKIIL